MHNSLRESFNSNRSKILLTLAVIWLTNSALIENLNAQNINNWAKTEVVNKSDAQIVADFTKPLGVTIPAEWTQYASNIIQMLDADGVASAQMILQQDLPKVAQADKPAYILMSLEAIRTAYDKEKHTKASDEFFAEYLNYENGVKSVTNRFAVDWNKRSEIYINQTKENINQKNQEAETRLLKLYNLNRNDSQLKTLATNAKKNFINTNYKYSEKTAEIFANLGIK